MSRHIIHKQKVTLQLAKGADAHFFQNCVSDLLQNQLPYQVETILDGLFPPDKIIRIDSLQLDLGNLDPQNFEQEFKTEFIKAFTKTLSVKKDILNIANNEEVLSNEQSLVHSFIYFLGKGYLPWYHTAKKTSEWESELLANFSVKEYDYVVDWLKDNYRHDPVIIQRLILQFSDVLLEKLLAGIAPSITESWSLIYPDFNYVLKAFFKRRISIRNEIWKCTFLVLLSNKDKEWPFRALKLLAEQSGVKILAIDTLKERDITNNLKTTIVQDAFKELVIFFKFQTEPLNKKDIDKQRAGKEKEKANGKDESAASFDERYDNGKELAAGWSRDKKKKWEADEDTLYVNNSGVVILHHFLKPFFVDLKLLASGEFIDDKANRRAVLLLYYLATGDTDAAEFDLPLQKILCGYPLENTLPASIKLTRKEKKESEELLRSVINYWPPLKGTSVEGLRSTFLQRDGKLVKTENGWQLIVEQKTVDILLGKLPWGFSTIRLPWMEQILNVDWY